MFDDILQTIKEHHVFSDRKIIVHNDAQSLIMKDVHHKFFIKIYTNSSNMIFVYAKIGFGLHLAFDHNHAKALIKNGYEFEVTNNVLRFNKTTHRSIDVRALCDMLEELL